MSTRREQAPESSRSAERLVGLATVALVVVGALSLGQTIVFATLQTRLAAAQNEIMRAASQPVFVISSSDVERSGQGACSQLTIKNEGAAVESFEVEVYTFVRVFAYPEESPSPEEALTGDRFDDWYRRSSPEAILALDGYYEFSSDGAGSGVLYQDAGLTFGPTNKQVVDNAIEAIRVELGLPAHELFGPVDTYLFIEYVDNTGLASEAVYALRAYDGARRLTADEAEQLRNAISEGASVSDSLSCYSPPSPEVAVAAYKSALASDAYADLPSGW